MGIETSTQLIPLELGLWDGEVLNLRRDIVDSYWNLFDVSKSRTDQFPTRKNQDDRFFATVDESSGIR